MVFQRLASYQPPFLQKNRIACALFTAMLLSLSSHPVFAKTTTQRPQLSPSIAQAIVTSATQPPADDVGSGDEPITNITNAPNSATPITYDDGGEVDIANGQVAVPASAPVADISNNQTDIRLPTTENQTSVNPLTNSLANIDATITQVPLGTVSPETIAKFVKMIDVIRDDYVKPVDDEALFADAMTGALSGLDPYSEYLDSEAFNNLRLFTEGDMGSIGVKVSFHADSKAWVFDEVLANSPAEKQGIRRGNFLHQINDNKLSDEQTQQDIDQLLLGIAGTQVKLVVSDSGRRKHGVTVQRSLVQQQAINANIVQGVAVVQIPVFQNNTQQQFLDALSALETPFSAILLDLRNNPGGVLSAANDIASLFMANKNVVQVKNRQGLQELIKTQNQAQLADVPLAVLQNRYSASAAEVLAISLQENGRAKIYGETSYGKGSIQSIIPLNDNEAVKLTVAHYYSGQGKKIDGVGVRADVPLNQAETQWEDQTIGALTAVPRAVKYSLLPNKRVQVF